MVSLRSTAATRPRLRLVAALFAINVAVVFLVIGLIENSPARARFLLVSRATWAGFAVAALAFAFYVVRL